MVSANQQNGCGLGSDEWRRCQVGNKRAAAMQGSEWPSGGRVMAMSDTISVKDQEGCTKFLSEVDWEFKYIQCAPRS